MYTPRYSEEAPSPEDIQQIKGAAVLEFGTGWCPICRGAQSLIKQVLEGLPDIPHIKVEDGPGRRLGRSFRVKLWPTLIFLLDGAEVARTVRPQSPEEVRKGIEVATADHA